MIIQDPRKIEIGDYSYILPEGRIAQYPIAARDRSKLLIYKNGLISEDQFCHLPSFLEDTDMLVFNNTRVIKARLLFQKETGAGIEILLLEPLNSGDYNAALYAQRSCSWVCMVGNLKKWKAGPLRKKITAGNVIIILTAEKAGSHGEHYIIRFSWDADVAFREIIGQAGTVPIPPYITREADDEDDLRYQTVYSRHDGSVAAPTAGLHFTAGLIEKIKHAGVSISELTLHVGAGTFKPVSADKIGEHEMHPEHFLIDLPFLERIIAHHGRIISVGTTPARTLESLYWTGVKIMNGEKIPDEKCVVEQWEPYDHASVVDSQTALKALRDYMIKDRIPILQASTKIIIVPGYKFRLVNGLITNFHLPKSTLLLLVAALIGDDWEKVYDYALKNKFRFFSYGDSSILIP
jgi:S-adenosylmethionine:tRNA ribosyltransferase-isomerase